MENQTPLQHLPRWLNTGIRCVSYCMIASILMLSSYAYAETADVLQLSDVERIALNDDPLVAAGKLRSESMLETSVADAQLSDPKLRFGLYNLPLDTYELDQEPTTQLRFGIQQAFPRGDTRELKQKQGESRALAEKARVDEIQRQVSRSVREQFLELYYQTQAERIVEQTRALFSQLVKITESHYASGRVSQQDVIRAELELSRLDDRATHIRNQQDRSRADLAKWMGDDAYRPITNRFPELDALPEFQAIENALIHHPTIAIANARLDAEKHAINIAKAQYSPGWSLGLEYRKRFGDNPDGSDRTDMMAAMVTMDVPLFTKQRQDRRVSASQMRAESVRFMRDDRLRELKSMFDRSRADWTRLGERKQVYQQHLLREAKANAQAALKAYQSGVTEFSSLMRARITELDVRLQDLRISVDRARAQARLHYLVSGDNS